ncbi:MAG: type I 3-dehydroquinate dehydratase [Phycisphaerales bacterium]|nr:type I 3-dehydroquinate dehydratase [Phycisphaerales bacterium]
MRTLVCVPITVLDPAQAISLAHEARAAGADIVELRVDGFFTGSGEEIEAIERLVRGLPLPCILTCRAASEGGLGEADDDARAELYARARAWGAPPAYVDAEYRHVAAHEGLREACCGGTERPALILSAHDFAGRPADLDRRLLKMRAEGGCRVLKVAFAARSPRDALAALDVLAERDRPTIALAMGEAGLLSRVLAPKFGGFLTFAALRAGEASAPGQPTIDDLLRVYRFRSVSAGTRVYGVMGDPVAHSLSPHFHNAAFSAAGLDSVYLPLPTPAFADDPEGSYASFKATLLALVHHPGLDFSGASVTLPHKESLVRLARAEGWGLDEASEHTGAANTVIVRAGGIEVINTDVRALARILSGVPGFGGDRGVPAGSRSAVIGAGGVARSAAYALARAGAHVTIYNRSVARAERLARDVAPHAPAGIEVRPLDESARFQGSIAVQCTSVGMEGAADGSPVPSLANWREHGTAVLETVYRPRETALLRMARRAGLPVIEGLAMFLEQASVQFEAWTGRTPERGACEAAVSSRLNAPT